MRALQRRAARPHELSMTIIKSAEQSPMAFERNCQEAARNPELLTVHRVGATPARTTPAPAGAAEGGNGCRGPTDATGGSARGCPICSERLGAALPGRCGRGNFRIESNPLIRRDISEETNQSSGHGYLLTLFRLSGEDMRLTFTGGVPERSKGSDCKSDGSAFGGSNPPPSTEGPRRVCVDQGDGPVDSKSGMSWWSARREAGVVQW